jgi:hypothetical protein
VGVVLLTGALALAGCSGEHDAEVFVPPSITINAEPWEIAVSDCQFTLDGVVTEFVGSVGPGYNVIIDAFGAQNAAFNAVINLAGTYEAERYRAGADSARSTLVDAIYDVCWDPAVVQAVTGFTDPIPGPPGGDEIVTSPVVTVEAPTLEPTPTTRAAEPVLIDDERAILTFSDGAAAPWIESASIAGIDGVLASLRSDPALSACPVIWPTDDLVVYDGLGEGLAGFLTFSFSVNVATPGGTDYGGAAVWIDGAAPTDISYPPWAEVERHTLANDDIVELAWAESNEARITTPSGCVWSFQTGSAAGLAVLVASLRTLA